MNFNVEYTCFKSETNFNFFKFSKKRYLKVVGMLSLDLIDKLDLFFLFLRNRIHLNELFRLGFRFRFRFRKVSCTKKQDSNQKT
jgi:hypothetical protein